ncbi:MAG: BlaI/MecI/CopY family transcriptional regulator [bacterium]
MKPTANEIRILKHLWAEGAQSQREIHLAIQESLNWSRSSTRKTLERMVAKGLIKVTPAHGVNLYRAKVKKIPTIATIVVSFAADVLGLTGPLPVSNLVQSELLNEAELQELDQYLKKLAPVKPQKIDGRQK